MKLHFLMIVTGVVLVTGCSKEPAADPAQQAEPEEAAPTAEAPVAEAKARFDEDVIKHMHVHADEVDKLNFALADGDLEGARTPALWIWQHDEVEGMAAEWQGFLTGMRSAALEVSKAQDLESARIAAERITAQCQGCHDAAGINET